MEMSAVILAAGEGKRMKSEIPKVLHEICGQTLLDWVISACEGAGIKDNIVVVGYKKELVIQQIKNRASIAVQDKQLGTGHAVMQATNLFNNSDCVLVLCGDTPLITPETIVDLLQFHSQSANAVTVATAILPDATGYGRIVKNFDGSLCSIIEQKDATPEQLCINEINSGIYVFETAALTEALSMLGNNNSQGEYYLTDTIEIIRSKSKKAGTFTINEYNEVVGINNRVQLAQATEIIKKRINCRHMQNGVTIISPQNTYIDYNVQIGRDTVILPGSIIKASIIGEECEIGPNTTIKKSVVGDRVHIENSVVKESSIGDETTVGPFAYIRPESQIGSNVKIGDFVEIKKSVIGNLTKVSHLTYIGDAEVGEGVNFGCGTVTVNYDSKKKHKTIIEDNAFIGCNANLIAPVTVKKNAFIAAGSTINMDVPENSLAIARARQENKTGWKLNKE